MGTVRDRSGSGLRLHLSDPNYCLFICSIFILLSRESDGSAIHWTNPPRLVAYLCLVASTDCDHTID